MYLGIHHENHPIHIVCYTHPYNALRPFPNDHGHLFHFYIEDHVLYLQSLDLAMLCVILEFIKIIIL